MKSKTRLILIFGIVAVSLGLIGTSVFALKKTLEKNRKNDETTETSLTSEETSSETTSESSTTSSESESSTEIESVSETTEVSETSSAPQETEPAFAGTITGTGREGTEGSGAYNYGEALQKSLLFYELQRSGDLPSVTRCNWRGDSCLRDGSDVGLDLTGGWFDAGDNVKFNLPMAYSASMLGWSLYEDKDAYEESGQLGYALDNLRWANAYFIKCHPEDEVYYYQVGDGNADHGWWGPAECVEYQMNRPSYCVTSSAPGSAVTGETAASLAICSILFEDVDPSFSAQCLEHAKSLYAFADKYKSDDGYTAANGFYNSWSGYYDELAWAGVWLYRATGEESYLEKAKEYYPKANQDFNWSLCWDDVHIGAAVLLSQETKDQKYTSAVEKHLDFWTKGTSSGERITYTPKGLAWLDSWGSLRYATTTAFVAALYSESDVCPSDKKDIYWDFAVSQAGYVLGDTGRSFQIGFGENYPVNPHHRTAQGSYCDNMNEPAARHVLCGALVGGPDASDAYEDTVSNYVNNEVACDYNAGFTGLLAKLYTRYHGQTLTGFGACETPGEEYRVEATTNAGGSDFLEIKAVTYNMTGWPARAPKDLELRYYFTLPSGKALSDLSVSSSYSQNARSVTLGEESGVPFVQVLFEENSCYPGGQEEYKKEVQFRVSGLSQDSASDAKVCLYEDGKLAYGESPDGTSVVTTPAPGQTDTTAPTSAPTAPQGPSGSGNGSISLSVEYTMSGSGNAIAANLTIENTGSSDISLDSLSILYYFTNEKGGSVAFDCYHSAINGKGGQYSAINGVKGSFSSVDPKKDGADTVCTMNGFGSGKLASGDKLVVQFSIHHDDWSDFTLSDDYSRQATENIVIRDGDQALFGNAPA